MLLASLKDALAGFMLFVMAAAITIAMIVLAAL
jgi:hypothetical protein